MDKGIYKELLERFDPEMSLRALKVRKADLDVLCGILHPLSYQRMHLIGEMEKHECDIDLFLRSLCDITERDLLCVAAIDTLNMVFNVDCLILETKYGYICSLLYLNRYHGLIGDSVSELLN